MAKPKAPKGAKAVIAVHPDDVANGDNKFMWTLTLNGRGYAQSPVSYTRRPAAVDSAHRFSEMLVFPVLIITQESAPDS